MKPFEHLLFRAIATLLAMLLIAAAPTLHAAPLTADQIVLVINRNAPQSRELAEFYAQARGIPADRIIPLDVPQGEEITFDRYERLVAPVVRQFLREKQLQDKIRCLVTFYGVPLRIADRIYTLPDNNERERLVDLSKRVLERLSSMVGDVEKRAAQLDPSFKPASAAQSLDALAQRAEHAGQSLSVLMARELDPQKRTQIAAAINDIRTSFAAPVPLELENPSSAPATAAASGATSAEQLIDKPYDRAARAQLRDLARTTGGIFGYVQILLSQADYLTTQESGSAVDSELSLLWWPAYSRPKFQRNLLNLHNRELSGPRTLMVMRLDAETPQAVRDLIANSLTTERDGLKGKFVIDTRGIAEKDPSGKPDAYGVFDEGLRRLASFVKTRSTMPLVLDEKPEVLPPGSVDDVALYCGWYSLRHYVPGMKFNRGAVGYHIASFELVLLHNIDERGWVHGLLKDGVVGTLGPVAEPYLASFPPPEEFFPLLMTGKLSLAEVYWDTTPLTSWMQTFIGDPLYRPFAKTPAVKVEDLPEPLRAAL
jgi:uncharacterized protein (TIGR03790 family)